MTNDDRLNLLSEAVANLGSQPKVAKLLGYSPSTISQALSGKYPADLKTFLTKVEEVFGRSDVDCPVLGAIIYPTCVEERRKPFTTANPHRVRMYQACRKCEYNTDPKDTEG